MLRDFRPPPSSISAANPRTPDFARHALPHLSHFECVAHSHFPYFCNSLTAKDFRTLRKNTWVHPQRANPMRNLTEQSAVAAPADIQLSSSRPDSSTLL